MRLQWLYYWQTKNSEVITSVISVKRTPLSGLEESGIIIDARIWYQTKPVTDWHDPDTRTKSWRQKHGVDFWPVCHGPDMWS